VKFKYNRALVTGGVGFIGSHIVDRLVEEGFEVRILDDLSSGRLENLRRHLKEKRVHVVKGDVRDREAVNGVVEDIDVVFHEAALVGVPQSVKNPLLANDVNVNGTLNLLEASVKHNVKRFILASSAAIYGEQGALPIKEEVVPHPSSPYAVSKLAAEHYSRVYHGTYGLETVVFRYFNVYGDRQAGGPYSAVITAFLNSFMGNGKPVIHGDGEQTRDFVNVKDVVDVNMLALEKDCAGEVFNVATGSSVEINRIFKVLQKATSKSQVQPEYSSPRESDIRGSCGDISKANRILGFKPKVSLEEGLECLAKSWNRSD
jgi:nucleoside-diphosphate-sugar epimerase